MKLLLVQFSLLTFALSTSAFLHKPAFSALSNNKMVVSTPNDSSLNMAPIPGAQKLCPELPLTPSASGNELAIIACG